MTQRPSRAFWLGLAAVAVLLVSLSAWVASVEWFSRDDFRFLAYVQQGDSWSWRRVFLPFDERFWLFYRPLSMETYFWLGFQLFGLNASGYFALSLALHFATGGLVYRVARQLQMAPQVAASVALLAVSRPGTFGEIYYGSVFMYVGQVAFALLCITSFLDRLRGGSWRAQLSSCLGLLLALLCNEAAVATPVLLFWAALGAGELTLSPDLGRASRELGRVLRCAAPQLAIVALYLPFRFWWIAPVDTPVLYSTLSLGAHVPGNAAALLALVFGGGAGAILTLLLTLALLLAALWPSGEASADSLRRCVACVGWLVTSLAPFVVLPFPQGRWAMPLAVPAALLIGVGLQGAWQRWGGGRPRALEAVLVIGLLVSLPIGTLRAVAARPVGAPPRRFAEWIVAQDALSPRAVLVVLYGAPGLASAEQGERFRYLSYGGGLLNALDPRTERVLRFQDLSRRPARNTLRADSVYLALRPNLVVEPATAALLDRHLRRRR